MIVEIPQGKDPLRHVWGEMVPGIGVAASRFATSVYEHGPDADPRVPRRPPATGRHP
jgi:hypothetical protein